VKEEAERAAGVVDVDEEVVSIESGSLPSLENGDGCMEEAVVGRRFVGVAALFRSVRANGSIIRIFIYFFLI
jgi:hypothetical protein